MGRGARAESVTCWPNRLGQMTEASFSTHPPRAPGLHPHGEPTPLLAHTAAAAVTGHTLAAASSGRSPPAGEQTPPRPVVVSGGRPDSPVAVTGSMPCASFHIVLALVVARIASPHSSARVTATNISSRRAGSLPSAMSRATHARWRCLGSRRRRSTRRSAAAEPPAATALWTARRAAWWGAGWTRAAKTDGARTCFAPGPQARA